MFGKRRRPREKMSDKDARVVLIVGIGMLVVAAFLPIPSVRLVTRVGLAGVIWIGFALVYKEICRRRK